MTYAALRRQLHYDPETGVFTRIAQTDHGNCALGKILGSQQKNGYVQISIGTRWRVYAHRLAWFYMFGVWPKEIDHINRDRADNRIANLREVTRRQNNLNGKVGTRNTSGVRGVSWYERYGKWKATVWLDNKPIHIGYFDTIKEAAKARKEAECVYY